MFVSAEVSSGEIGYHLSQSGDLLAEVLNTVGCRVPALLEEEWQDEFVTEIDKDGRALIKRLAAAIDADEKSEGGA